jgi:hypothetical protein
MPIREPEFGFPLVCSLDISSADGFGPDVNLTPSQTIAQGAVRCDFRYERVGT